MKWRILTVLVGAIALIVIALVAANRGEPEIAMPIYDAQDTDVSPHEFTDAQPWDWPHGDAGTTTAVPAYVSSPLPPPQDDLVLTGLSRLGSGPCAMFAVMRRGEPVDSFMLREGQANDWLEVLAVDPPSGTVKAILLRPVVRIRKTGVEVILSYRAHGQQGR